MSILQKKPESATNAYRGKRIATRRRYICFSNGTKLYHKLAVIACSCAVILGGTTIMVGGKTVKAFEVSVENQVLSSYASIEQVPCLRFTTNEVNRNLLGFNHVHYVLIKDTDFESDITRQKTPQEVTGEALLAELSGTDYTQLTKTPLKEVISQILKCIHSFRNEGLDIEEACMETYGKLMEEYNTATAILEEGTYKYPYTDKEYALLAKAVMREQGANVSEDNAQSSVACVILNRRDNNGINGTLDNPTILDILQEPGQYGKGYSWNVNTSNITDKVWENTRRALEHEFELPSNVMYQALFKQGSGVYAKYWNPAPYNSWTYICYV